MTIQKLPFAPSIKSIGKRGSGALNSPANYSKGSIDFEPFPRHNGASVIACEANRGEFPEEDIPMDINIMKPRELEQLYRSLKDFPQDKKDELFETGLVSKAKDGRFFSAYFGMSFDTIDDFIKKWAVSKLIALDETIEWWGSSLERLCEEAPYRVYYTLKNEYVGKYLCNRCHINGEKLYAIEFAIAQTGWVPPWVSFCTILEANGGVIETCGMILSTGMFNETDVLDSPCMTAELRKKVLTALAKCPLGAEYLNTSGACA